MFLILSDCVSVLKYGKSQVMENVTFFSWLFDCSENIPFCNCCKHVTFECSLNILKQLVTFLELHQRLDLNLKVVSVSQS